MLSEDTLLHPRRLRLPLARRAAKARIRARPRARRGIPEADMLSLFKGGCKKKAKCHFEELCTLCFGDHPATECPQKNAKDTRGKAN